jgi:type IX secretion system PorP/SprF family membrane protein
MGIAKLHIRLGLILMQIIICINVTSQQLPLYSQYMYNLQNANVGYTGAKNCLSASLIYRTQWVGFKGAPTYQHFTIQMPIQKENAGIGIQFVNDKIGEHSVTGAAIAYAYKIKLSKGNLAFGLRAFALNYKYNWDRIIYKDKTDNSIINSDGSKVIPSFDFGTIYYSNDFFIGIEAAQLTRSKFSLGDATFSRQTIHFTALTGKSFKVSEQLVLKPSVMTRFVADGQFQADINASFLIKKTVWLGVGYRTNYGLQFLTEVYATPQIRVGYSYDYALNNFKSNQSGSHEIFLGIDFNVFKTIATSARYF